MSQIDVSQVRVVFVNDSAPTIELALTEKDKLTARNLSGYAAWFTFALGDAAPHIERAAKIYDAVNGVVRYALVGDEYSASGLIQFYCTIMHPTWNSITGAYGFFEQTTPAMYRRVLVKP